MAFTATWTLPAFTASAEFEDDGHHGYAGENTLPAFDLSGEFGAEDAAIIYTGDKTLPRFDLSGTFIGEQLYVGDLRLPAFSLSGVLAAGNAYEGVLELPLFSKSGQVGALDFSGTLVLPAFAFTGRFEAAVAATFRGWPINLKNGALSEYSNFPFNSFARFNGEYLGAGTAGIFGLSGDDDAGTDIDARARLALSDLGLPNLKRLEELLLNYRSDGTLILRVVVDGGQTYEYPLEPTGKTGIYQVRVKTGKGLKVNYVCVEVANFEGADFDLDSIRARPVLLSRSIGGS